jgi:DNA-binding response OmpR family regulator
MSVAGATILVVDDEPAVLDTVRDGLLAHGYQVLTSRRPRPSDPGRAGHTPERSRWR